MVFDIQKKHSFMTSDVQNNIKILHEKFGSKFKIKYKNMNIPVVLVRKTYEFSKSDGYFVMKYDVKRKEESLYPFKISFFDQQNLKLNNNVYIDNIQKTDEMSGTKIIKFVLYLLKKLGVHKASLFDGASVACNESIDFDLSYLKLIEKGRTYYQKFGFKISLDTAWVKLNIMFDDAVNAQKQLKHILQFVKKLTVKEYVTKYTKVVDIITRVIKDQQYSDVDIITTSWLDSEKFVKKKNIKKKLWDFLEIADNVLTVLKSTKRTFIYQVLLDAAKNKQCLDYDNLLKGIMNNGLISIAYKNASIKFNYYDYLNSLQVLRDSSRYEIVLNKESK